MTLEGPLKPKLFRDSTTVTAPAQPHTPACWVQGAPNIPKNFLTSPAPLCHQPGTITGSHSSECSSKPCCCMWETWRASAGKIPPRNYFRWGLASSFLPLLGEWLFKPLCPPQQTPCPALPSSSPALAVPDRNSPLCAKSRHWL